MLLDTLGQEAACNTGCTPSPPQPGCKELGSRGTEGAWGGPERSQPEPNHRRLMCRQDQGTAVSPCPANCTTQGDTPELGPSSPKANPHRGQPRKPQRRQHELPCCLSILRTEVTEHPAWPRSGNMSPLRGDPTCHLWESFNVPFALCPPRAAPGARAGEGSRAPSRVSPCPRPSPDAQPWRASLTHSGGFVLAPTPRSKGSKDPSCSGTSALRGS